MASIKRIGKDKLGLPIWEVVYRRTPGGKQIHRRIHAATKAEVERQVLLDVNASDIGLRWSEGLRIYLDAKLAEGRGQRGMQNVAAACQSFIDIMGDIDIEKTTPEVFKTFMQAVVSRPVLHHITGKEIRKSGSKVANRCRKEMLAVARHIRAHTGKIVTVPFEHVPTLPTQKVARSPIPRDQVNAYLEALQPHLKRPALLILFYGMRSSAVCNITLDDVKDNVLMAVDKNSMQLRIPFDDMLAGIVADALAFRDTFKDMAIGNKFLFVTANGTPWNRMTFLQAAQRSWVRAGLEKKKIHELRHTLGTLASRNFDRRMVQAAMHHLDESSAAAYFHPDEDMAAEVRQKIVTELSQVSQKPSGFIGADEVSSAMKTNECICPYCHRKFLISKGKGRNPKRATASKKVERAKGIEPS